MRRILVALIAMATTIAAAAPPWSSDEDDIPQVTDPSVPLTYVGGDGSVSIGFNADGETEGQLMGVFGRNDERAVVGQLWWDRNGAGGVQGDYNWLWGATAAEVREDPSKATVARLSFAVAQNAEHNRKATLGFGIERRDYSVDAYLSRGLGGGSAAGSVFDDSTRPLSGSDDIGSYTELEITTVETLLQRKAYDTEVGVQFSHVFDPLGMRVYGGAGLQDGEGDARAEIYSIGLDSPLGRRGWAMSARAEHQRRDGDFEDAHSDTRVSFFLRYQFGGRGVFVPASGQSSPAWVQRAFGRASNAAPRTVDSYIASAGTRVTVSHGPREYHNYFPLAQADSATTGRDTPVTIDVLANDADPDGDPLLLSEVSQPANGTASIQGGRVLYTPDAGFTGVDTFTYNVVDPDGGAGSATVTVTVEEIANPNQPPVARDDTATTQIDTPVSIAVLANDSDPDNDVLSIIEVGAAASGTAVISGERITYTPAPGFIGSDSFTYTISDGNGGSMTATVRVTVAQAANRPPIAGSDSAVTTVDTPVVIPVLDNDFDPDGDPLLLLAAGTPASGTAVVAGIVIIYTPNTGFTGTDTFSYSISDGRGGVDTAVVSVRVDPLAGNNPPVAVDDTATTATGVAVSIPVLANDSDPDGDPLTILSIGTPTLGSATISGSNVIYTPPATGVGGIDSFGYSIGDGNGGTASATITVTIGNLPNQPPVAVDDAATTTTGVAVSIPVLANDSDPDGDPLTILSIGTPTLGSATISGSSVVYTPSATAVGGIDSFGYSIGDGNGGTASATITVTISNLPNQPPVAVDDFVVVNPVGATIIDVLANDSDPDGDPLSIVSVTAPSSGSATIIGNMVTYTAAVPFPGTATFDYTISDGQGGTATATVTVNASVNPNQPPVANDDNVAIDPALPSTIDVLANDFDPEGDPLTIISVGTPATGTAVIAGNEILYTAGSTFPGNDAFTYTISDGNGGTASATVRVTGPPAPNQPPVASDDAAITDLGLPVVINVLANDSDPDGDPLLVIATSQPDNGLVSFNNKTVTYSPNGGFSGADAFTYTISDGRGGTASAQVVVTVNP